MLLFDFFKFNSISNIVWSSWAIFIAIMLYFLLGKGVRYGIRAVTDGFDVFDEVFGSCRPTLINFFKIIWPVYLVVLLIIGVIGTLIIAFKKFFKFCWR